MRHSIECEHEFLEINYNNITMDTIIKFKKNLNKVLNTIKLWENTKFANFIEITNSAYGMMNNPYKNIIRNVNTMKNRLNKISENISEYWILENISFIGKKQTFNPNIIVLDNSYNRNAKVNENIDEWIKIIENFDKSIKLYNKAVNEEDLLLKKALHFPKTLEKIDGYYYRYTESYYNGVFEKIKYNNNEISITKYHFGENNWYIYSYTENIEFSKNDGNYDFIWKNECPELYLS